MCEFKDIRIIEKKHPLITRLVTLFIILFQYGVICLSLPTIVRVKIFALTNIGSIVKILDTCFDSLTVEETGYCFVWDDS